MFVSFNELKKDILNLQDAAFTLKYSECDYFLENREIKSPKDICSIGSEGQFFKSAFCGSLDYAMRNFPDKANKFFGDKNNTELYIAISPIGTIISHMFSILIPESPSVIFVAMNVEYLKENPSTRKTRDHSILISKSLPFLSIFGNQFTKLSNGDPIKTPIDIMDSLAYLPQFEDFHKSTKDLGFF